MIQFNNKYFLSLCLLASTTTHPQIDHDVTRMLDEINWDDEDMGGDMLDFADAPAPAALSRANPIDIITLLKIVAGDNFQLLQNNFFSHTNSLARRNIIDSPLFEPPRIYPPERWNIGGSFFWHKVNKSFFAQNVPGYEKNEFGLESYLKLTDPNFLSVITKQLDDAFEAFNLNFNVEQILSLFRNMTVEKRELGFMLQGQYHWRILTLRFLWPLYYHESNLNFPTEAEKDAVFDAFGIEDSNDETFQDAHFVSDQFGFGDARIEFDASVYESHTSNFRTGLFTTLPIAFAFKKGLKGTYFPKRATINAINLIDIDLDALFDMADDPDTPEEVQESFKILTDFLLGSLDHMNGTLLDSSLGTKHLGIGMFMRSQTRLDAFINRPWAAKIYWHSRGSVEYFFPRKRKRFYLKCVDPNEYNKRDFMSEADATDNLMFLEDELTDRFYPLYIDTKLQPGLLLRWTSRFMFKPNTHWTFTIGSDWWLQTKETFSASNIEAPSRIISQLDIPIAKMTRPYQGKILLGLSYDWERPTRHWYVALNGDATLYHNGIGDDYTVALHVEARF